MKKYVFMYNIDEESLEQEEFKNKLNKAGVDFYFEDSNVVPRVDSNSLDNLIYKKVSGGSSLWVSEEHYLIAFTILNYENLLGFVWYDNFEGLDVEYCLGWYDKHKDNELFVKYFD